MSPPLARFDVVRASRGPTSQPALVASIAAIRLGALDLAVANFIGGNVLNLARFFALHPGARRPRDSPRAEPSTEKNDGEEPAGDTA